MKYICQICGYVYDEEKEGVPFSSLSADWTCPMCQAPKDLFLAESKEVKESSFSKPSSHTEDFKELQPGLLSVIFSNLARGCEKQYKFKEQELFLTLANYFKSLAPKEEANEKLLLELIKNDLNDFYLTLKEEASKVNDRGTKRICVWGEKVTNIQKVILERYQKEGLSFLEGNKIFVCSICGFIYIGKEAPTICPVCKVPDWKFVEVGGMNA